MRAIASCLGLSHRTFPWFCWWFPSCPGWDPRNQLRPWLKHKDMTPVQRVKVTDPQSTFLGSVAGDVALFNKIRPGASGAGSWPCPCRRPSLLSEGWEGPPPLPPTYPGTIKNSQRFTVFFCCSHFSILVAYDGSTWANIGRKMGQHSPIDMGQPSPKMGPRWANIAPRWANIALRRAQIALKIGQHSPKMGQDRPT